MVASDYTGPVIRRGRAIKRFAVCLFAAKIPQQDESSAFGCILNPLTGAHLKRWLAKRGCTFSPGKGGHLIVALGEKMSTLPMHGKRKEFGTGLVKAIKKQLGLGDEP